MGKLRWYKRDPDAALGGMMALTLEERGAYNTVLDLIYSHADKLPDDDRFIAGWCNCDVRVWRRLKARLISLGKLYVDHGMLRNFRATSGVDEALSRVTSARNAANIKHDKSAVVSIVNNDLGDAPAVRDPMPLTTTTITPTNMSVVASARARVRGELEAAWPRLGNDMADVRIYSSMPMVDGWLGDGADLEADVLPTISRIASQMAAKGQGPPNSLKYFAQAVADAKATRSQGLPNGHAANTHGSQPRRHANGGAPSHAGRYPSGGRQTDGSITGALAFLARQRAENGDDS